MSAKGAGDAFCNEMVQEACMRPRRTAVATEGSNWELPYGLPTQEPLEIAVLVIFSIVTAGFDSKKQPKIILKKQVMLHILQCYATRNAT